MNDTIRQCSTVHRLISGNIRIDAINTKKKERITNFKSKSFQDRIFNYVWDSMIIMENYGHIFTDARIKFANKNHINCSIHKTRYDPETIDAFSDAKFEWEWNNNYHEVIRSNIHSDKKHSKESKRYYFLKNRGVKC